MRNFNSCDCVCRRKFKNMLMWKGKDQTTIYSNFSQIHRGPKKGQTVTRPFQRLAKALIRLRVCAGWSESLLVAHITLLGILCRGSFVAVFCQRREDARGSWRLAQVVITSWRNVIRIATSRHEDHTAACLKELSLTFQLLVIEKIPQSYG